MIIFFLNFMRITCDVVTKEILNISIWPPPDNNWKVQLFLPVTLYFQNIALKEWNYSGNELNQIQR